MTHYQSELVVDFGELGYRNDLQQFKVRLKSEPLSALIADAENAVRVYELLLITRPGDLWDYVVVVPEIVPHTVASRLGRELQADRSSSDDANSASVNAVSLPTFDGYFHASWDDTDPEDAAWLKFRRSAMMSAYLRQLLTIAQSAQGAITWNSPLVRHITACVRQGKHPYDALPRALAIERSRETRRNAPSHTQAFYRKLRELLQDGDVASIAYRASGDFQVLRMLATEQRRRMTLTGHAQNHALYISALVNDDADNSEWDAEIHYHSEGLGYGDLFIDGGGLGVTTIKELIEKHNRRPGRYAFSAADQGEIKGYAREAGDGWWLYTRDDMQSRRQCLNKVFHDRHPYVPIMALQASGNTLFAHEYAIIVVGAEVNLSERSALAAIVHEWQCLGGSPLLVVEGDVTPFADYGCHAVLTPPHGTDALAHAEWLHHLVWDRRPWTDAVILLRAPQWARAELMHGLRKAGNPWNPWYIVAGHAEPLETYLSIDEPLADTLALAFRRAHQIRFPNC